MKPIVIDGIYLAKKITGIQRYAIEITKELDKIVSKGEVIILVPKWCVPSLQLNNIKIIRYGNHSVRIWEQIDLPAFLKKFDLKGLFFENTVPIFYRKGIVAIHDISLKTHPEYYCHSLKGIFSIIWRCFLYRLIVSSDMKIVTVSNFSKKEIVRNYHIDPRRITVIYNAWQHMNDIEEDEDTLTRYSLNKSNYYFSLATLAPNKNFKWIIEAAKNNQEDLFAVAGGGNVQKILGKERKPDNLIFLGYVTDGEAKSLMKNCKAFIYPSLYEGFGIPPLEAVACGASQLLLSDIPVFREIYKNDVSYFNPLEFGNRIIIYNNKTNYKTLFNYSWHSSGIKLFSVIRENK